MTLYSLFCHLTPEQKEIILKNYHTIHFFCHYDNIQILNKNETISDNSIGFKYYRSINAELPEFNINYDLIKNMYFQNTIKYKIDDTFPKLSYQDRRQRPTSTLHVGQIKMFLTTLQFLTNYIPKNKETHILYPGSAYGTNIHFLSKLFPNCYWYLIDPLPYYKQLHDNDKILHMSNKFFTNKDAEYFKQKLKNKFTLFISDIRNRYDDKNWTLNEINIDKDMIYQSNWCKIFNADYSFLKFRVPRLTNKYTYLEGELFLQPFATVSTTEARLVVKKNAQDKIYDLDDYEDKLYYHNRILRVCDYSKLHNYKLKYFCNCYDCSSFFLILENYINKYNPTLSIYALIEKVFKYIEYYSHFKNHYNFIIERIK